MSSFKILSIDGGGIRGIIPAMWLGRILANAKKSPCEYFDLITGTSTGSIIAAAMALNFDIEKCLSLYRESGPVIFPPRVLVDRYKAWDRFFAPAYDAEVLASELQKLFGKTPLCKDAGTKLLIPTYDVSRRHIFCLKSYASPTDEIAVWEACKSSSCAPTYFAAHILELQGEKRPLIDGGVFANNPSMLAISEAISILGKDSLRTTEKESPIKLISLGTGNLQRKIERKDAENWGSIQWVRPLIDVLFDSASEMAHVCARQILSSENYVRFQVDLFGVNDDLDDSSINNIENLIRVANNYLDEDEGKQNLAIAANMLELDTD